MRLVIATLACLASFVPWAYGPETVTPDALLACRKVA